MELTFEVKLDYGDLTEEELGDKPDPTATDIEEAVRTHLAGIVVRRPVAINAERQ